MMIIAVCQRGFLNLCEVFHIQLQWRRKWSKRSKIRINTAFIGFCPPKPICTPFMNPLAEIVLLYQGYRCKAEMKRGRGYYRSQRKRTIQRKKTYSMALADTITGGRGPEVQTDVLPKAKFTVRAPCAGVKTMTIPPSGTNGRWE